MPDITPASPERTVVVSPGRSRLFTILTVVNSVILVLIIIGAIIHHHRMKHERGRGLADGGRDGGAQCERGFHGGFRGGFHHFRHFGFNGGGQGFDRQGGFDGNRFGGPGGGGFGFHHGMGRMGGMDMPRDGMGMGMAENPDQMADAILQHLSTQLSLTDDQKAKIKPLIQSDVAEFQKNARAIRDAMQKQFADAKAQIKPLLNADQQKQLDALPVPGQRPVDGDNQGGPAAK